MKNAFKTLGWLVVVLLGVGAYLTIAFKRNEPINSAYILIAAVCSYAIGYRFYSSWIAAKVLMLNDRRATPCEVNDDGKDFVKTNKWIVFGHHFAAISGPGPLVGPVLAAQFGYLPGALWILIGVVLGGAVQDFVILFSSMRRNGKSLGQMVKEELNTTAGYIAMFAILAIMVILLAVLALIVVKALAESPWGVFTVGATIPIAMFMGCYLRFIRAGKVMEVTIIGIVLLFLAVWGGKLVHEHTDLSAMFTLKELPIALAVIVYGLAASVLPVWLLLAPRDYLSTFMKLGTIFALAVGILVVLPVMHMPAITDFASSGEGLVFSGKLFPFCFITIACGAISGFHTLIASGTTPKIIGREGYSRPIGYGAMCLESLVAIMALIAACTLDPGVYFAMNVKGDGAATAALVTSHGYPITVEQMELEAAAVGEHTLFGRAGGAATLAVGMAHIFSKVAGSRFLDLWYHFAIMFEALFILTTIDAGTRVGRYLLQDLLSHVWKPLGDTKSMTANFFASTLLVIGWGYFLVQGVRDPLGGINSLWPLFGIANQLLAGIALCLATTVILKMQLNPPPAGPDNPKPAPGKPIYALVTIIPLIWLMTVTMTAGWQKLFHESPKIGFLAQAKSLDEKLPGLQQAVEAAKTLGEATTIEAAAKALKTNRVLHFNMMLDTAVTAAFLIMVALILIMCIREWTLLFARKKLSQLQESPPVWLPEYAVVEGKPFNWFGLASLVFLLAKELSSEAAIEREQQRPVYATAPVDETKVTVNLSGGTNQPVLAEPLTREEAYLKVTERRFEGVTRCC
jgi:carbon starvation protein